MIPLHLSALPVYESPEPLWNYAKRVGAGPKAEAFQISDTKLVRLKSERYGRFNFARGDNLAIGDLIEEQRVANQMHEAGIKVLKPEGVFRVPLSTIWKPRTLVPEWLVERKLVERKYFGGLVMQYVNGKLLEQIPPGKRQTTLHERVAFEIDRATRIKGFSLEADPDYNHAANVIVDEQDNFFFIGLGPWRRKKLSVS